MHVIVQAFVILQWLQVTAQNKSVQCDDSVDKLNLLNHEDKPFLSIGVEITNLIFFWWTGIRYFPLSIDTVQDHDNEYLIYIYLYIDSYLVR